MNVIGIINAKVLKIHFTLKILLEIEILSLHQPLKYARPGKSWNIFYHIDRKIVPTHFITKILQTSKNFISKYQYLSR